MVSVQLLRAIAVIMVIMFHILLKSNILGFNSISFSQGAAGVDLFFIISGFIMAYITNNKEFSIIIFAKRRLIRILPLYWLISILVYIVYLYNPSLVNTHNGVTNIFSSFSLLPSHGGVMLLEVGWTLRYEFLFYLIFAISMKLSKGKPYFSILPLILLASIGLCKINNYYMNYFTNSIILEFVLGIYTYYVTKNKKIKNGWLFILLGVLAFLFPVQDDKKLELRTLYYGIPMLFIFIGISSFEENLRHTSRLIKMVPNYLGNASYSLYLSHTLSIGLVAKYLVKTDLEKGLLFIPLSFIFALIFGVGCYEFLEKPMRKYLEGN